MDIAQKLEASLKSTLALLEEFSPERSAVAWTGGKDSTLALFIWRKALAIYQGLTEEDLRAEKTVRALNLDTGLKFPEIIAFRDSLAAELGLDLHIARPGRDAAAIPPALDKLACCRARKVEPLQKALESQGVRLLLTGVRADESPARLGRPAAEEYENPPHRRVYPILDFTEMDVWAAHQLLKIPYCSLYNQGYRSLGCQPCTVLPAQGGAERSGRAADKESMLNQLHSLGYF